MFKEDRCTVCGECLTWCPYMEMGEDEEAAEAAAAEEAAEAAEGEDGAAPAEDSGDEA